MHPLSIGELGDDFSLSHSLHYGCLPSVYVEDDPKEYLAGYYSTYLKEEVQQEGLTRNLSSFTRFLEAASFSQGSTLNITQVARDCSVERKVVENYFIILEDLLLAKRMPVFSKRAKRKLAARPKFYFFDTGLYRAIRPAGPLDRPEEVDGSALETLIFQQLSAINHNQNLGFTIYYWRTGVGKEVDFVLYGEKGIFALEVKRTQNVRLANLSGLRAFHSDYPQAKLFFLYGGERTYQEGSITVLPLGDRLNCLTRLLSDY